VHTGGTILAVLQDEDGVRLPQQTLAAVEDWKPWRPVGDSAANDLILVSRIMGVVVARPGVFQTALRDHLPDADWRRLATLATWLERQDESIVPEAARPGGYLPSPANDSAAQDVTGRNLRPL
jgi:hypothetical protein